MKSRITFISLLVAVMAVTASAADVGVHGGYYWGDLKNWAAGVDAQWPIGPIAISPNIDFSRKNGVNLYLASGDVLLRYANSSGGAWWIGAGPTYSYATSGGDHTSEWDWDATGGISFGVAGMKPYVTGRYIRFKGGSSATGAFVGLRF